MTAVNIYLNKNFGSTGSGFATRVDSFVFLKRFVKHETVRNRSQVAEIRSFGETEKI